MWHLLKKGDIVEVVYLDSHPAIVKGRIVRLERIMDRELSIYDKCRIWIYYLTEGYNNVTGPWCIGDIFSVNGHRIKNGEWKLGGWFRPTQYWYQLEDENA